MKIRVYYEDTDAGGIVYHANYIKYCERARSELFFEKNMIPTEGDRSSFVVRRIILPQKSRQFKKKSNSLHNSYSHTAISSKI